MSYEPASVMDYVHLTYTLRESDENSEVFFIAVTFDDRYKLSSNFTVPKKSFLPDAQKKSRAEEIASQLLPGSYDIYDEKDRTKSKMVSPTKRPAVMHRYFTFGETHQYTDSEIYPNEWYMTEFTRKLINPHLKKFLKLVKES